ncbi:ABC transporter permease subunit [Halostagnicola kamekurae]|uniref:ABC-2 type transport system permease protein n=1 Tax=Halostagnicola kamekurae TaxID=619731 RepID=A0A1I6P5T1_9EURY|nr:ABC transporter permease subunit [Halostagnicola kamekurae]SFS35532.1 ABC-2 type transport system permease protein [Halostagnicola kamekurae]
MAVDDGSRLGLYVREDVRDTVRERQAQVILGLYALVGFWVTNTATANPAIDPADVELFTKLSSPLTLLTPLLVLGFFCSSLVEKRTSGALTVVLGLPFSRKTVVLGTLIGRSILITTAILLATVVALPIAYFRGISIDPVTLVGSTLVLILLAITFTAIAVLLSATTRTATRATVAAFTTFVIFAANIWAQFPRLVVYAINGLSYPETFPAWYAFVVALNPMAAYTYLIADVFPALGGIGFIRPPQEPAFYERPAFAVAVLLGWIAFATWFGHRRFRGADL